MQSVYAVLRSRSDDLKKEEKFLLFNIHKSKELYVLQLMLLLEIRDLAGEHIEIRKKKYLATEEDRNPNMKFIENRVLKRIEESAAYVRSSSILSHSRWTSSATCPVMFEPEKISTTRSPGSVKNLMKNIGRSFGNRAGWGLFSSALHVRR